MSDKELKFKCPGCGGSHFGRRAKEENFATFYITIDKKLEVKREETLNCDLAQWECRDCNEPLRDFNGSLVEDNERQVIRWLEDHQEEGLSVEDDEMLEKTLEDKG